MNNKIQLPDGLGIRLANTSDNAFIEQLFNSTRQFLDLADAETDYLNMVKSHQLQLQTESYGQQSPDAMTFIIDKQGTSIGRMVLDFGKNIVHIIDIALIVDARGKGYGKSIIQAVQHIALKQSLPLGLTVDVRNLKARQLYASLGFQLAEAHDIYQFLLWYPTANRIQV
ncbi:hypothetical protein tinsulaeT_34980 [Thalassotalea insulae]|uniref:N-acetyltransferase domain-containing protein n=2 Tax=Thalassotalea insulae TaxID=2056778 RepID=A0ABQ6GW73_9GAMM|nr:hypothetical protein tinsulaeT_34980 [Thalassotalea insulae]